MANVPEFNIEATEEETRTNLPGPIAERLELWLQLNKVEYRVLGGDDIPDDWIQGWHFRGRSGVRHTVVFLTKLNSEQLHQVAEQLMECTDEDIRALM